MIKTRGFRAYHVDQMTDIKPEFGDAEFMKDLYRAFDSDKSVVTIFKDDKPIAVVGARLKFPKVASVFSLMSCEVRKCPLSFFKEVSRLLEIFAEHMELQRAEIEFPVTFKESIRWAEALGFEREGVLKNYGFDNVDYYLYARCSWAQKQYSTR